MNIKKTFCTGILLALVAMPVYGEWETSVSKDRITGQLSGHARSPVTTPTKKMAPPYSDAMAWLGVDCDGKAESAYIGFNLTPDISDKDIQSGYNIINARIKWGGQFKDITLTQEWHSELLHFEDDESAILNMTLSSTMLLELQWKGEGTILFEFPLGRVSKALKMMRKACSMKI